MGFDDFYPDEGVEEDRDLEAESAGENIVEILEDHKVVTDRELKVRLEKKLFPWVVERGLKNLLESEQVKKVKLAGRRSTSSRVTESFFALYDMPYDDIQDLMREKKEVSNAVNNNLTGISIAGDHAEELFMAAFEKLDFKIHGRDVSEFNGNKVIGEPGKPPPNVDFVVERDGLKYGLDVKNWIRYEISNRQDLIDKVDVAMKLKTIPFMAARYVDKEMIFRIHQPETAYGMTYRYGELLFPTYLESLATKALDLLGYPIVAIDELPKYKVNWIEKLHQIRLKRAMGN